MSREPGTDSGPEIHVVLVAPEIPWNTGNIGRTCVATGARLHLVRPLGFSLEDRYLRRAGLDYWQHLQPTVWGSWAHLESELSTLGEPWLFSAEAELDYWQAPIDTGRPIALLFGSETGGLPPAIREQYSDRLLRIPMAPGPIRSLNLSTSVALAIYEVMRRGRGPALL